MIDKTYKRNLLGALKHKLPKTYQHSLRMAAMCDKLDLNSQSFCDCKLNGTCLDYSIIHEACLLHDIGKLLYPAESWENYKCKAPKGFQNHSNYSYELIRDEHDILSQVVLYHHCFQKGSYPHNFSMVKLDSVMLSSISVSAFCQIRVMSFILSCLDYLDATTTRINKPLTKKSINEMISYKSHYEPASDIFLARELFEGLVK
jgi:hypothetical protein